MQRSVLVTGGSRGLGLEIARWFAAAGDSVAVTHHRSPAPDGLFSVQCDVTDRGQVTAAVEQVKAVQGPVEVLVSNAGITADAMLLRMDEDMFHRVLDTNLSGAYRVARAVCPDMMRLRWGRMIFISSVTALKGVAGQANYAASKAGLIGFSRSLAREVAKRNVTVNVIAPGLLDTDLTRSVPQASKDRLLSDVPIGRMSRPEEVAAAAGWLASDLAGCVTGAVIPVDGGASMGH